MRLDWGKCKLETWCSFLNLDLDDSYFAGLEGVYVIWYQGTDAATVYVGQGNIAERIKNHRNDARITAYSRRNMVVSWAKVDAHNRDGVERFLIDQLNPKVGERKPNAYPIEVNFPWSK